MKSILKIIFIPLFILFQFTFVYGDNPLVGEYSINEKHADLKIAQGVTGKYKVFIKESEEQEWKEMAELRPATADELHHAFGDRWNRVETSLVLQNGLVPQIGFYYIKSGQFGTDLINEPTCFFLTQSNGLTVINKYDPTEVAALKKEKENATISRKQRIEGLKSADPLGIPPYGDLFWEVENLYKSGKTSHLLDEIHDKVVEWYVFVDDVTQLEENYRLTTSKANSSLGESITPDILLSATTEDERKFIEALTRGTKIKVRGHLIIPERPSPKNLSMNPAILVSEPGLAKSEAKSIHKLKNVNSSEVLSLETLQSKFSSPNLTSLQITNIQTEYQDKIVEGTVKPHSHKMNNNSFWGYTSVNVKGESGNGSLDVYITCQSDGEFKFLDKYQPESEKPIRFRGVINGFRTKDIRIWPAILISGNAIPDSPRGIDSVKNLFENQGTATGSDVSIANKNAIIAPADPGERYPETRLKLLVPADLTDLNSNDIRYAINEMYARHGAVFKNAEIAKSFTEKKWFKPRPGVSFEEIEREFSAIEAKNLKLLGKERARKKATATHYELIDSESNLREGPGTNYPIVRKSRKGEVGESLSNKKGWMNLQFSDDSVAWAHEQNLRAAK